MVDFRTAQSCGKKRTSAGRWGGAAVVLAGIATLVSGCAGSPSGEDDSGAPNGDPPEARCQLPQDPGPCLAWVPSVYFDAESGLCRPFVYGGCGGNENQFSTRTECHVACAGPREDDPASCSSPADCVAVPAPCGCEGAPESVLDLSAVRSDHVEAYFESCPLAGPDCVRAAPDWAGATCSGGYCVAIDLR